METRYRIHKKTSAVEVDVAGDREFVVEQFERLWEVPQGLSEGEVPHQTGPSGISMAEYVNGLEPKSQTDVALAIAGYLYGERHTEEFGKTELEEGFREILRPVPGNTSQTIANLVRQGSLMKRGKREGTMSYSVTQSGLGRLEKGFGNNDK